MCDVADATNILGSRHVFREKNEVTVEARKELRVVWPAVHHGHYKQSMHTHTPFVLVSKCVARYYQQSASTEDVVILVLSLLHDGNSNLPSPWVGR